MIVPKCECGVKYRFICRAKKDLQIYACYQCPICGTPTHEIEYAFNPLTCPGHRFEHIGHEFVDGYRTQYTLEQVDRCYLCGLVRRLPKETRNVGFSKRVEIDHPQVSLLYNRSAWDRKIPLELRELTDAPPPERAMLPAEGTV